MYTNVNNEGLMSSNGGPESGPDSYGETGKRSSYRAPDDMVVTNERLSNILETEEPESTARGDESNADLDDLSYQDVGQPAEHASDSGNDSAPTEEPFPGDGHATTMPIEPPDYHSASLYPSPYGQSHLVTKL